MPGAGTRSWPRHRGSAGPGGPRSPSSRDVRRDVDDRGRDPENAAGLLHIRLTNDDIEYLSKVVEWDAIATDAPAMRERLHLDQVTTPGSRHRGSISPP